MNHVEKTNITPLMEYSLVIGNGYGQPPFLIGTHRTKCGMVSIAMLNYQRVGDAEFKGRKR